MWEKKIKSKENISISKELNIIIKPLSSIPFKNNIKRIIHNKNSIIKYRRTLINYKIILIGKEEGDTRDTYEIGKKIWGGSFGLVFLSVNKRTGGKEAIKTMRKYKKDNKTLNNDLLKEVEMLKTLVHQNFLNIIEFIKEHIIFYCHRILSKWKFTW